MCVIIITHVQVSYLAYESYFPYPVHVTVACKYTV